MKTFWDWQHQQLPDGTVIWTLPDGHTYVTTPASALLFPSLCAPTGEVPRPASTDTERCGQRTAMMPKRRRTRAQGRAYRVATERRHNRDARLTRKSESHDYFGPAPPHTDDDDDPPPF